MPADVQDAVALASAMLSSDGVVSASPEARIARHEVLEHIIANEMTESPLPSRTKITSIKRQITPDSVLTADWETEEQQVKRRHAKLVNDPRADLQDAEFVSAEVAYQKAVASMRGLRKVRRVKPLACQVCQLPSDKWVCRLPLYLNARDEPVNLPGTFCSKACFEHI